MCAVACVSSGFGRGRSRTVQINSYLSQSENCCNPEQRRDWFRMKSCCLSMWEKERVHWSAIWWSDDVKSRRPLLEVVLCAVRNNKTRTQVHDKASNAVKWWCSSRCLEEQQLLLPCWTRIHVREGCKPDWEAWCGWAWSLKLSSLPD